MPRCSSCQKFVSVDAESEPDVENIDVNDDGDVDITVRIANSCAECSQELSEATLEMSCNLDAYADTHEWNEHLQKHHEADEAFECPQGKEPSLSIDETGTERTTRTEGKGRGLKTFYGAKVEFEVKCECNNWSATGSLEDDVQASAMDPLE